jgi:hypothetical protein
VLSRSGVDLLASREAAIVSSADVMSTEETGFPWGTVSERRWFVLLGEGAEGKELVETDGDSAAWVPLGCMKGRLSLREVEGTAGRATFSGGVGGKPGEDGASGRETGFTTWTTPN